MASPQNLQELLIQHLSGVAVRTTRSPVHVQTLCRVGADKSLPSSSCSLEYTCTFINTEEVSLNSCHSLDMETPVEHTLHWEATIMGT